MITEFQPENLPRRPVSISLGQPLASYPHRNLVVKRGLMTVISLLLIFTAIYLSLSRLFNLLAAIEIHGRAILLNPAFLLILVGLILLLFGIICLVWVLRHEWDGIMLYENGMTLQNGKKEHIWYWHDINQLDSRVTHVKFGSSTISTRIKVTLGHQYRNRLILRHRYENMMACIHQIRNKVLPILYDRAHDQLSRQEYLEFGKGLRVKSSGLEFQDRIQLWSDLENPLIDNGLLKLLTKPDHSIFFQSKIHHIKNLDLLVHLINYPPVIVNQTNL